MAAIEESEWTTQNTDPFGGIDAAEPYRAILL